MFALFYNLPTVIYAINVFLIIIAVQHMVHHHPAKKIWILVALLFFAASVFLFIAKNDTVKGRESKQLYKFYNQRSESIVMNQEKINENFNPIIPNHD